MAEQCTVAAAPPESRRRVRTATVLVLATLAVIGLSILFLDTPIARAVRDWEDHSQAVALFERVGYHLGDWTLAPAVLAIVLIAAGTRWRRFLLSFVAAYAVRTAAVELLKWLTGRARPRQMDGLTVFHGPSAHYHSFPSGHAAFAFMFATILAAYWPRWRVLWYGLATWVALSRLIADAHFLSDIIMAALVGVLSAMLILRRWPPQPARSADAEEQGRGAGASQ